ncbi:ROK family glucokinase [Pediococcus cellicola]|uniref:Glucokinase n=1 Tax=Pediococcus cellicola TaxID=319652 RepID=A0A0R2IJ80_9LACO|nr:ROK family glucokinase [Pediococcus cellicola]KRN65041.1 glucokinase [Pediococcus cellicola]GEL15872.1 glucokinase [Pediococcus cellicola]
MTKYIVGVDLGGTRIKIGLVNTNGDIVQEWSIPTNKEKEGSMILPDIVTALNKKFERKEIVKKSILGIGIGVAGNVDYKTGYVRGAYNLNWKHKISVKSELQEKMGVPVFVENDSNVAALGEHLVGNCKLDDSFVLITLGTGIGAGMVINGNLYRGATGCSGEIGHDTVVPNGPLCTCGKRGCLETVASATGVVNVAKMLAEQTSQVSQIKDSLKEHKNISSKEIFEAAEFQHDEFAKEVVDKIADYLGHASADIANMLNPNSIVFGGGVSAAGEFLRRRIEHYYHYYVFKPNEEATKIKMAGLQNNAGIVGAAALVMDEI